MPLPVIAAAAVPAVVATVLRFVVGYMITRTITIFGMTLLSFTAINYAADQVVAYVDSAVGSVSGPVHDAADLIGFFDCVNILVSAWVAAIGLKQLMGLYDRIVFGRVLP